MKVLQVNNFHKIPGGSDVIATATAELLRRRGHEVLWLTRDSKSLCVGLIGRLRAFICGIYSMSACQEIEKIVRDNRPDIVHVHELFPFISPWILNVCRRWQVPVVMHCPNYQLTCPTAHHFLRGGLCEMCVSGREYWCVLKNCRSSVPESIGYAMRTAVARKLRLFLGNVTLYLPPICSVKRHLANAGFPETRIVVLPNLVSLPGSGVDPTSGKYVAYAGRISPEKGVGTLLEAAQETGLPVQLAGDYSPMPMLVKSAPHNARFIGPLNRRQLTPFYQNARFLVVPSICLETFGLVAAEAMSHGLPVIASRMGGLTEVVDDGVTGYLCEPGNASDLAAKMRLLWDNPDLCRKMGQAGREKAACEYSEDVYYRLLMAVYRRAIRIHQAMKTHETADA